MTMPPRGAEPGRRVRTARSVTYQRRGDVYEVTVGQRRRYRPAGPGASSWLIGAIVTGIFDAGDVVEVWSEDPAQGWDQPTLVGHSEITSAEWIGPEAEP